MDVGETAVATRASLGGLISLLVEEGYDVRGPVVRDAAIILRPLSSVDDLPRGWHDEQSPGHYRLRQEGDPHLFGWAVGPASVKSHLFPPVQELRLTSGRRPQPGAGARPALDATDPAPVAFVGVRPCELAAMDVLDRVLLRGAVPDPHYADRRRPLFVVVAECGHPAATCFCTSMGTGPGAEEGFDLALTELEDPEGDRFLVRTGTERGADMLSRVETAVPAAADMAARQHLLFAAASSITRHMPTREVVHRLEEQPDHPRWADVAERCLACGNCTLACPTCFCCDVRDTTDVSGEVHRQRSWSSCFDLDHSYLHGGPVRSSTSSRYRQWATHKLSTWWSQFGTSGCVGCGRCITWCPVGIDLTEEVAAICGDGPAAASSVDGGAAPT